MTLDSIPFDDIPPRSLLIVRAHSEADLAAIRARVDSTVTIAPMQQVTDILCISEATMGEMGWVRSVAP